jgi:selenide,water dikinase
LKKNGGAQVGSRLFLTKPLGVGILTTAQKKGKLRPEDALLARNSMVKLNRPGMAFGVLDCVEAMTDVTGFGLLGHLSEMCLASQTQAVINYSQVPVLDKAAIDYYLSENCVPGGTQRNWESYGQQIGVLNEEQRAILCDPQTSGGLLVAVSEEQVDVFLTAAAQEGLSLKSIGWMEARNLNQPLIRIK